MKLCHSNQYHIHNITDSNKEITNLLSCPFTEMVNFEQIQTNINKLIVVDETSFSTDHHISPKSKYNWKLIFFYTQSFIHGSEQTNMHNMIKVEETHTAV